MIVSVVGNFLCIFNICNCLMFFEMFIARQEWCVKQYQNNVSAGNSTQLGLVNGDQDICVKCWVVENDTFIKFADINGSMLFCLSEILAIFPYFLRALRIKKMFDARESYWQSELIQQTPIMPKRMIAKWEENRVMCIFLVITLIYGITYMCLDLVFRILPNYNSMSTVIDIWYNKDY